MSLAHELRVLDIESQIELLDRLRLLTRFGSNLTNITGAKGSGKSWIAQRYLEAWAQDKNQSLLMCHPNQSDEQRKTTLLNQLFPSPLFNPSDPISESFARMIQDEPCDMVIVVDDAQLLGEELVAELWTLVLQAQVNPAWNINVILFTTGDARDKTLSRLSYGQENKPISLEIESLNKKEVEMFVELLVLKYVLGDEARNKVRARVGKTPPLPGALMALGDSKVEKRIIIRSIIGSPLKIGILVLILLLLLAGGYFWFFSQPMPGEAGDEGALTSPAVEQTVIPTLSGDAAATTEDGMTAEDSAQADGDQESDATDDSTALPPTIVDTTATVGHSDDGKRVVVPSVVVDALMEGDTSNAAVIDGAVDQARQEQSPPVAETDFERDETIPPLITFSFSRQELLAVSDRHYTLQLAAFPSLQEVQVFITQYDIESLVRIYPTLRNDTRWYIVTYKDFPTIQEARNARSELSEEVRGLDPWAKSMLQVHREIERAN